MEQYLVMVNVSLWQTRTYIVRFKKKHNNANRTCPVTVVLGAGFANRLVFVIGLASAAAVSDDDAVVVAVGYRR